MEHATAEKEEMYIEKENVKEKRKAEILRWKLERKESSGKNKREKLKEMGNADVNN